jgi:hypothetical protein
MTFKSHSLFRTAGLIWRRAGPVRIYLALGAALLVGLAIVGLVHLASSRSPAAPKTAATEKTKDVLAADPLLSITEIGVSEAAGRKGQRDVSVKIGVAPRRDARHGEVEIRVAFFDVTPAGEMRATDAQVDYQWLTPKRDWADPAPKYLVATYAQSAPARVAGEKLRYGGFLVRVYFDGQLQAERSEPRELIAALRNPPSPSSVAAASPSRPELQDRDPPAAKLSPTPQQSIDNVIANVEVSPSAIPLQANRSATPSGVPFASPVPDKPGFVYSPYDPKFLIDVRGFPPGTQVTDPNSGKIFKVP